MVASRNKVFRRWETRAANTAAAALPLSIGIIVESGRDYYLSPFQHQDSGQSIRYRLHTYIVNACLIESRPLSLNLVALFNVIACDSRFFFVQTCWPRFVPIDNKVPQAAELERNRNCKISRLSIYEVEWNKFLSDSQSNANISRITSAGAIISRWLFHLSFPVRLSVMFMLLNDRYDFQEVRRCRGKPLRHRCPRKSRNSENRRFSILDRHF
jgi:hypothetical protein